MTALHSDLRASLVFLCRRILHPLVRILIRFGISAGELKAIVDSVYAHAASEHLSAQGDRVSYSKLAVITGINRSFLPAILSTPEDDFRPRSQTQLHRAARVLNGWHNDVDFQTRAGDPAVLPISGKKRSFEQLTYRYSGGVYYPTLLAELVRLKAVKVVGTRKVRALRRAPMPTGIHADAVYSAGDITGDLLSTLNHNLAAKPNEQLPVRTLALRVDRRSLSPFRAQLAKRADGLLEMTDAFLQTHRSEDGNKKVELDANGEAHSLILGAGVFAICRPSASIPFTASPLHREAKAKSAKQPRSSKRKQTRAPSRPRPPT